MFLAPAQGERLADLEDTRLPDALHALGRAIACLHQSASGTDLSPFQRATPGALRRAALPASALRAAQPASAAANVNRPMTRRMEDMRRRGCEDE